MAKRLNSTPVVLVDGNDNVYSASAGGGNPNGQATSANSAPVVIASDQSAVPFNETQLGGQAINLGQGATGTGTQRVLLATDDPLVAQFADVTASGNITTQNLVPAGSATAGSSVAITPAGRDTLDIQVTGTYTGALSVQGTLDGTNWTTMGGTPIQNLVTGGMQANIASASVGIFQFGVGGFQQVRVTALAAQTGTAAVVLRATTNNSMVAIDTALPAGTATLGSIASVVNALPTGGNTIGAVNTIPTATASPFALTTAATTNATSVKASAGSVFELTVSNITAATIYMKLYNKASAPTVGTDVPIVTVPVAAGATATIEFGVVGKRFSTGIAYATTAAAASTDTTVITAGGLISGTYI